MLSLFQLKTPTPHFFFADFNNTEAKKWMPFNASLKGPIKYVLQMQDEILSIQQRSEKTLLSQTLIRGRSQFLHLRPISTQALENFESIVRVTNISTLILCILQVFNLDLIIIGRYFQLDHNNSSNCNCLFIYFIFWMFTQDTLLNSNKQNEGPAYLAKQMELAIFITEGLTRDQTRDLSIL